MYSLTEKEALRLSQWNMRVAESWKIFDSLEGNITSASQLAVIRGLLHKLDRELACGFTIFTDQVITRLSKSKPEKIKDDVISLEDLGL